MSETMVYIGDIAGLPDGMLADLLRNPSLSRDTLMQLFATDVPAIVVQALAEAPTVEAAAAAAVNGKLAAADVPLGTDKRILPGGPLTESGWYLMPESTGYIYAYVVVESARDWYIVCGITLEGYWEARTKGEASGGDLSRTTVTDAIQEWWIGEISQPFPGWVSTVGLGDKGQVLAIDFNDRTGPVAVEVGVAPINDHCVPGRYTIPGRGSIMQWTPHNTKPEFYMVVAPGSGRAETFTGRPVQTISVGSNTSYGQIRHLWFLQTATTDTFRIFLRNDLNWSGQDVVVDWAAGTATKTGAPKRIATFPDQCYMTSVPAAYDSNGNVTKVRLAFGYNPAASRDDVYLVEMDMQTGDMHDKAKPSVTHNIDSGSYLSWTALTPVLPNKPAGTRRLFGVTEAYAGDDWKLLTAEYAGDVGPTGQYVEHTFNVQSMTITGTRNLGTIGRHLERYPAGAQFDEHGDVWRIVEADNVYRLYHENDLVRSSAVPMFRPMPVKALRGAGDTRRRVLFSAVGQYTSFISWAKTVLHLLTKGA